MLHAVGLLARGLREDADWRLLGLEPGDAVQHAPGWARGARVGRRQRCRRQARRLRHHHGLRRHLDGDRGDEVLPRVAGSDCRFARDRRRRRGLRRPGGDWRLRQEHAGDGHRPGAAQSALGVRLRRHHPPRHLAGSAGRHRVGVRGRGEARGGPDDRRGARRFRVARVPGRGVVRRHVHRQHHGLGDRGPRAQPPEQLGPGRDFTREAGAMPSGRALRSWGSLPGTCVHATS